MEDADYFEGSAAEWGNEADGGTVSTCGRLSGGAGLPGAAAGAGGRVPGLKRPAGGGSALESGGLLPRDAAWAPGGPRRSSRGLSPAGLGSGVWGSELRRKAPSVGRVGKPSLRRGLGLEGVKREENNCKAALGFAPSLLRSRVCLGSGSLAAVNGGV